jgi:pyrroline-5-carboxylate reductase
MVLESGRHPGELKDMVCSPGGTAIAGVAALESGAFRSTVIQAVKAAWQRAETIKN